MDDKKRLSKILAERLGISRREADDLIASGKVIVNHKIATLGERAHESDTISVNGKNIPGATEYIYIALNKPRGYVSSRRRQENAPTLYELLPEPLRKLKTIGRLDRDSEGLILLTNDGQMAFQMTHPKFYKIKEYEVRLDRKLAPLHQQMIADFGVELKDGRSKLGLIKNGDARAWRVIMSEGRNRQIRRTFGALGYTVTQLKRVRFGDYILDGLETGQYVQLPPMNKKHP